MKQQITECIYIFSAGKPPVLFRFIARTNVLANSKLCPSSPFKWETSPSSYTVYQFDTVGLHNLSKMAQRTVNHVQYSALC